MSATRSTPFAPSHEIPAERLERAMPEVHPPFDQKQALAEANRCLYCHDAPCIQACPTAIDIPEFIRRIATQNLVASAKTILDANILGLSCARVCPTEVLCAGACVYNHMEQPPIDIGRLQRFATEHVYDEGIQLYRAGEPNGRTVCCVGGGPASLACAAELALLGYQVTILEGRELPGGLNTTGVAPYKLYVEDSLREVAYILDIGNVALETGRRVTAEELPGLAESYDAVFLGLGLGGDSALPADGADADGVMGAVELIELLKNRSASELGWVRALERVVVVGGGNTSLDVVRELRALGVPSVTLVYRRDEASMSAYRHEVEGGRREGGTFLFQRSPVRVVTGDGGRVTGLEVVHNRLVPREGGGRPGLEAVEGSEHVIPADLIVSAIGQGKLTELVSGVPGIEVANGCIACDPDTGRTGDPRFYTGGDCANGAREVVDAAAEGKRAARGIHAWLEAQAQGKES
jgi:glutamate synthase (NADPH/NADH) small chain